MPLDMQLRGGRFVYVPTGWPDACKLRGRPQEEMTVAEIRDELKVLDSGSEAAIHRQYCTNPGCPAKQR